MPSPAQNAGEPAKGYAQGSRPVRLWPAVFLTLLAACSSRPPPATAEPSPQTPAPADTDASAAPPEAAIEQLNRIDPGSPEALEARLEYADQMIGAQDADCQTRLGLAQSELDTASAIPSFDVVLPLGKPRLADLQYRLHVARASCKALAPERESELRLALAAARGAVELYRDALDYAATAVAQFNVAVTQRLLGDNGAAQTSLEAAIVLDKEFGLHQDAADNTRLLAQWNGTLWDKPTVPMRAVTLNLWFPHDAQVTVRADESEVIGGKFSHGEVERTFQQHVQFAHGSWIVSYQPGEIRYDTKEWPQDENELRELASSFEQATLLPTFQVKLNGTFERVRDLDEFSSRQTEAAGSLILEHVSADSGQPRLNPLQAHLLQTEFRPATVGVNAAQNYQLQVGMWIGAVLQQGTWYRLAAPLTLPGARREEVPYDVEFAYTRDVPCTGAATERPCVELVVHGRPQRHALESLLSKQGDSFNAGSRYWSTTYIRIVTDPETLSAREYDVRRYWHISRGMAMQRRVEDRYERIVATFTYP